MSGIQCRVARCSAFWLSDLKSKQPARFVSGSVISFAEGSYLLTALGENRSGITEHLGSCVVHVNPFNGGNPQPSVFTVNLWRVEWKGSATILRDSLLQVSITEAQRLRVDIETPVDRIPVGREPLMEAPQFEHKGKTFHPSGFSRMGRTQQLEFPCTIASASHGLKTRHTIDRKYAEKIGEAGQRAAEQKKVSILQGITGTVGRMSRWCVERSDDTVSSIAKLDNGDDCDGLSMTAVTILKALGVTAGVCVGVAELGKKKESCGHMWVVRLANGARGPVIEEHCEATAVTSDKHFKLCCYVFTDLAAYECIATDGPRRGQLGAPPEACLLRLVQVPDKEVKRRFVHYFDEAVKTAPKGATAFGWFRRPKQSVASSDRREDARSIKI